MTHTFSNIRPHSRDPFKRTLGGCNCGVDDYMDDNEMPVHLPSSPCHFLDLHEPVIREIGNHIGTHDLVSLIGVNKGMTRVFSQMDVFNKCIKEHGVALSFARAATLS